ncbi:MAG TPA: glycosyltransferase family 4 protein [Alphaproteobacteria bacterium]|nr:glycosyltransferase family 4 protein [Alphaproteobacteria bacterium]
MHVGIVAPCSSGLLADLLPDSGGVDLGCGGYLIATLVRALVQRQHRVSVITLSPEIEGPITLMGPNLQYCVYPMRTSKRMRDLYKLERQGLREGIGLAKPDVLHAHWTYEFALACMETSLPAVITTHDNAFQVFRFCRDLYRLGRLYLQIRVIRKARWLTAVSPYLAYSLRWLARTEIAIIPNPIEVSEKLKEVAAIVPHPLRVATVLNGWGHRKNPKAALRAFALLRREVPDAQMYMYGADFEAGGVAARWAMKKRLARNIHFCGFLPHHELQQALSRMSLLLHPALEESFGMVLVEAMALGLPVIAGGASGGVPWVLNDGRAGYLTDVTDPEAIARTLLTCIEQVEDRQRRQKAAYQRVLSLFSPDAVAARYETIYEKAVALQ